MVVVVFDVGEFSGDGFDWFVFLSDSESESGSDSAGELSEGKHSSFGLKALDQGRDHTQC